MERKRREKEGTTERKRIELYIKLYYRSMRTLPMQTNATGYLELFMGPMFSGKTSKLLDIYKQCTFCNIPVTVINHSIDKRYHDTMLSTHDELMIPCIPTDSLMSPACQSNIEQCQVILINEGQFFQDLYESVVDMLSKKKTVYIAGLDGDFERKPFGEMLRLIPLCDKFTKLTSLCSMCKNGTLGLFSLRLSSETEQIVVGSRNYIPVCRYCYDKHSQKP